MGGLAKARAERTKPEKVRQRIQVGMILNRLHQHIRGHLELKSTQIKAAQILLAKTLPDLSAMELTGELNHNVISAEPVKAQDWAQQYVVDGEFTDITPAEEPQNRRSPQSNGQAQLEESSSTEPLTPFIESLKRSQGEL